MDGLDIDYEYPSNDEQARGYVALLRELRAALDRHAHEKGAHYKFLLTVSALAYSPTYFVTHSSHRSIDSCTLRSRQLQEAPYSRNGQITGLLEHDGL